MLLGVAWRFGGLRLDFDAQYFGWENVGGVSLQSDSAILDRPLLEGLRSTWSFALGGEYGLEDRYFVRLGVRWDPSPVPPESLSAELPDADRLEVCGGLGYHHPSGFTLDLGYLATLLRPRSSTFAPLPGRYGGAAHAFSLTVGLTL
jgi:long-subunit fatty acid transport protein